MTALPRQTDRQPSARQRLELASGSASPETMVRLVTGRLATGRVAHLRFLRSRLRCVEDAEDALQDFSLKALQGAGRLTDSAKVDAWLNTTLRNTLFDRYRRNAGRIRLQEAVNLEPVAHSERDEDLEPLLACLEATIRELKPDVAALLRRAELEEIPLKDIAIDLSITPNNVGVRVHRAREALRQRMRSRCDACAAPCPLALAAACAA